MSVLNWYRVGICTVAVCVMTLVFYNLKLNRALKGVSEMYNDVLCERSHDLACELPHVADLERGDQIRKVYRVSSKKTSPTLTIVYEHLVACDLITSEAHNPPDAGKQQEEAVPQHGHKLPPELVVVGEKDGVLFLRAVGGKKPFLRLTSGDAATTKTK